MPLIPIPEAEPVYGQRTAALAGYISSHLMIDLRLSVSPEAFMAKVMVFMPDVAPGEIRAALSAIGNERRRLNPTKRRLLNARAHGGH